ncbi:MAG: DUF1592 domain-containing protein [Verrucomicrobia bacterium]|nr:DUF1592 domain-containing protein [Verrucomicrobiota bacterium]MDA1066156.1 DUF1592 domain-containing protein [Verrucomicrobiota bacterium]
MNIYPLRSKFSKPVLAVLTIAFAANSFGVDFDADIQPILQKYCINCHGGEKVKGEVDFTLINNEADVTAHFELWETVSDRLAYEEMPPEEEDLRPSLEEAQLVINWYEDRFVRSVEARPGEFKPRRLSAPEYRNTLRTLFGFDLEVAIIAAEQTKAERSLVIKLLPTDPPGESGFINDTNAARLSSNIWEQYAYLADRALEELFSDNRLPQLEKLIGEKLPDAFTPTQLSQAQAKSILRTFSTLAYRRPLPRNAINKILSTLKGLEGQALVDATKTEMKVLLVSPQFLYRGHLLESKVGKQQLVDKYELAERLSYFLWEDMPDEELIKVANKGRLDDPDEMTMQIDRMLASPKARSLAGSFGGQWLDLADIDQAAEDVTEREALRSQPLDFLNYLFTEDRPVMELIDSEIVFTNYITASFYPKDSEQLKKYVKFKGIERELVPNQRITLEHTESRGGILTMPGILAMNRGPILRGTWMLRRIMGERLGEPPADVPAIKSAMPDETLSFRERFEQHRSDPTCARCHDRIDPFGFALQAYDDSGAFKLDPNYKAPRRISEHEDSLEVIDTSGQLPSGEGFEDFEGLKQLLLGAKRQDIIRNVVEQVLAYALCRKLESFDRPTVTTITEKIDETNGSWRDLFIEVALSLPFQQTYISPSPKNES